MKKALFGTFAALALILTSCGGSAKTAEQIDAEAKAKIDKAKTEWQTAADNDCNGKKEGYKTKALDSLRAAAATVTTPSTGG